MARSNNEFKWTPLPTIEIFCCYFGKEEFSLELKASINDRYQMGVKSLENKISNFRYLLGEGRGLSNSNILDKIVVSNLRDLPKDQLTALYLSISSSEYDESQKKIIKEIVKEWITRKKWKEFNPYITLSQLHGLSFIDFEELLSNKLKKQTSINCAIGVTDNGWFSNLEAQENINIVNFWTPTPWSVSRLKKGDVFYFMLKSPIRKIGGFGYYNGYDDRTPEDAWARYGKGNGVNSLNELQNKIKSFKAKNSKDPNAHSVIGCIELINPVFFEDNQFKTPEEVGISFESNIVKFKYGNIDSSVFEAYKNIEQTEFEIVSSNDIEKVTSTVKKRKGQSLFRSSVLKAYNNCCAISGEECIEIVQAAHIQLYINESSNHIQNGIPLRVDLHQLFDLNLLAITEEYKVKISSLITSDEYLKYDGQTIKLPNRGEEPSKNALILKGLDFRC